MPRVMHSM